MALDPFACIMLIDRILLFLGDARILSQVNRTCRDSIENYAHDYWNRRISVPELDRAISSGWFIAIKRIAAGPVSLGSYSTRRYILKVAIEKRKTSLIRFIHSEGGEIEHEHIFMIKRMDYAELLPLIRISKPAEFERSPRCYRILLDRAGFESVDKFQMNTLIFGNGLLDKRMLDSGLSFRTILLLQRAGFISNVSEGDLYRALSSITQLLWRPCIDTFLNDETRSLYDGFKGGRFIL